MLWTPKQAEFIRYGNHRWNFKGGGTRTGKTYLDFKFTIPSRIRERIGKEGLAVILGVTKATIERNVLEPMRTIYGDELVGYISSDNTVKLFGEKCYALGAEKLSQVSKLRGASIKYCYGDEVSDWSKDVFDLLKSRLDKPYSTFDGTFNPQGPAHWLKEFLDSDADIFYQTYTIDDNPFLPKAFVENLKKEYSGTVLYDRYILGLWTAAEGSIYTPWNDDQKRFIKQVERKELARALIGWDFGGNGSASAGVCIGVLKGYKGVAILREYYHKGIITPERQEAAFVEFARSCKEDYGAVEVRCDSAEQTLIAGFKAAAMKAGLRVDIRNAIKGEIINRIRFTLRCMGRGAFYVDPGCKHVQEALSAAVYDSKHVTEDVRLDNGTTNIDSLDAMEYAFEPAMDAIIKMSGVN